MNIDMNQNELEKLLAALDMAIDDQREQVQIYRTRRPVIR